MECMVWQYSGSTNLPITVLRFLFLLLLPVIAFCLSDHWQQNYSGKTHLSRLVSSLGELRSEMVSFF